MKPVEITDDNFETEVIKSDKPVLIDFWAVWCGPCQMQNPILEEISKDFEGKAKIAKLNVDENPETASKYQVMSIPTLMIFNNGSSVKQMVGVQSRDVLAKELNSVVSK